MYKKEESIQISFYDFNQSYCLQLDPENDWIKRAKMILWYQIEESYAKHFPSKVGNVAKYLRMVLGSPIIQKNNCQIISWSKN